MRGSALPATLELNASKRPLGTKLGTAKWGEPSGHLIHKLDTLRDSGASMVVEDGAVGNAAELESWFRGVRGDREVGHELVSRRELAHNGPTRKGERRAEGCVDDF